jgi:hypothetical protein
MKRIIFLLMLVILGNNLFSQAGSVLKFIFVPHPRSEDQVNQNVYSGLSKIEFKKYDVIMLGGDITYSTSKDSATLAYCNSIFNISSPNTLWSFGNHDVQSGHRSLIKKFTGRESYYSYYRNGITFLVLDTELNAVSFSRTFILGDQLQMVKDVCDSIKESKYLVLLHSRYIWMINNDYFKTKLTDSIAASSRSMDTTNFYSDIYPLLQNVKNKGVKVLVFGGDKSKINIIYSPEDSITFYAARMAVDLPDSLNNVIVIDYNQQNNDLKCNYVPLTQMVTSVKEESNQLPEKFVLNQNYPNPFNPNTVISYQLAVNSKITLKIFNTLGEEIETLADEYQIAGFHTSLFTINSSLPSGIYFYVLNVNGQRISKKMCLLK